MLGEITYSQMHKLIIPRRIIRALQVLSSGTWPPSEETVLSPNKASSPNPSLTVCRSWRTLLKDQPPGRQWPTASRRRQSSCLRCVSSRWEPTLHTVPSLSFSLQPWKSILKTLELSGLLMSSLHMLLDKQWLVEWYRKCSTPEERRLPFSLECLLKLLASSFLDTLIHFHKPLLLSGSTFLLYVFPDSC